MSENLTLQIRATQNGFVASFSVEQYVIPDEFVALAPADLRSTVLTEIEKRMGDMIDRLIEYDKPEKARAQK